MIPGSVAFMRFLRALVAARFEVPRHFAFWRAGLLAAAASLVLASCASFSNHSEKEIRYELSHRFSVDDPQFLRSMGQLLGPAIVPGRADQSILCEAIAGTGELKIENQVKLRYLSARVPVPTRFADTLV